ncbi:unnamed protein product [Microthlaspi erraticum]|uniref:DUF1216 domain-containing protein n=1 Tax=Microthlaspi erraticum TaxID=1685480 RepID=A0A6D2KTM2_9BRAS|nr:unnamed protein product [Microthlaspi erraticum]
MARISLLFSLAFALAVGSLFLSVSGHAAPSVPLKKTLCPKTVSELQTLPFTEITKILKQKEKLAPKTAEFKAMFTMCKGYIAYLESVYKFENPIVDVLGIAKTKYALMTKAILVAQASVSVSVKVDKKTSLKLKKSCGGLIKGFLKIQKTIVKISAKHDFKANAKISVHESKVIGDAVLDFKSSISAFVDVVIDLEKKKTKKVGLHARTLEEDEDEDAKNSFERFLEKFSDKFGGYLGGKTHGRDLTEAEVNADAHVGAEAEVNETIYERFSKFFGGYLGGDSTHGRELTEAKVMSHGRELYVVGVNAEAPAGANAGAQADVEVKSPLDKFTQFFGSFLGSSHGRELYVVGVNAEAPAGANAGAQADVEVNNRLDKFTQFFGSFLGSNHGRELYVVGVNSQAPAGANTGAQADVEVKTTLDKFTQFFGSFLGSNHGRELTEAGKTRVAGKDGFRSRNRAHYKHFVSMRG